MKIEIKEAFQQTLLPHFPSVNFDKCGKRGICNVQNLTISGLRHVSSARNITLSGAYSKVSVTSHRRHRSSIVLKLHHHSSLKTSLSRVRSHTSTRNQLNSEPLSCHVATLSFTIGRSRRTFSNREICYVTLSSSPSKVTL